MPMLRKTEETPKSYSLTKMEVQSSNQLKNNVEIVGEKDETLSSICFGWIFATIISWYQISQTRMFWDVWVDDDVSENKTATERLCFPQDFLGLDNIITNSY